MKTLPLLAVAGGIAYLGYRKKQAAEQAAMVAALSTPMPPPANSGPVVNGLSFYQLEGLGSRFGRGLKRNEPVKPKNKAPTGQAPPFVPPGHNLEVPAQTPTQSPPIAPPEPDSYYPPVSTYTPPPAPYIPPPAVYTPPASPYVPPPSVYTPPASSYSPPAYSHEPVTSTVPVPAAADAPRPGLTPGQIGIGAGAVLATVAAAFFLSR